jgi:hypothetical protein
MDPESVTSDPRCPRCGRGLTIAPRPEGGVPRRVERCLRCGLDRLYTQKDFNRTLGLAVFVVAAILSVPTWGLSLVAATIIDLVLYFVLGDVTLCYGCGAQHRGFEKNPAHGPFDLHVAEAVDREPRAARG